LRFLRNKAIAGRWIDWRELRSDVSEVMLSISIRRKCYNGVVTDKNDNLF
jgi:hypothetical protein